MFQGVASRVRMMSNIFRKQDRKGETGETGEDERGKRRRAEPKKQFGGQWHGDLFC